MGHGHHHHHDHNASGSGLRTAFLLNLGFTLLEIVGGLWTNSVAILTDALHDAGDCLSLGAAWYLQRLSEKQADAHFTYGYRRFSVLGALLTGVVLFLGVLFILSEAVKRLLAPQEVYAPGMIVLAVIGVIVNGIAVLRTRGGKSLNVQMVSWHLLEDVLGWGAVLVGSIIMTIWDLPIVDPLLSFGISLFILWNVLRNLRKVFAVLLQKAPSGFDAARFQQRVLTFPKVQSLHHIHTWSLDGEHHVLTTHVVMEENTSRDEIAALKERVRDELSGDAFEHISIDVELENEACVGCH
jgi:cobalt-zinc-cadmium efflux system protein